MLSPFQRALVEAVLKRYQSVLDTEVAPATDLPKELCLWVDWSTETVALSEKDGYVCFACVSAANRAAAIRTLKMRSFNIIL